MSSQRPGERVVHQDYIARIRYSNALPPPPTPPKLLDIPGTGLAGGQYTSAGYASKLAREQPLNIEADAELGMPIDMIGVPGIFDGDERAISIRPGPSKIHPADKELLKPLSALGKAGTTAGGYSFLRRTEYTSSQAPQHFANSTSKDLTRIRNEKRRKSEVTNKDDPINIIRNITKGFDLAYPRDKYRGEDDATNVRSAPLTNAEEVAWNRPKHPSKSDVHLLDSYPLLPDMDALPPSGCFIIFKFNGNPLAGAETYDQRLDTAILRPIEDPAVQTRHNQRMAEWDETSGKPQPIPEFEYEYYVPASAEATTIRGIKRKFDVNDPDNDDPGLYTDDLNDEGDRGFKFERVRTYETHTQSGNPSNFYGDTVALALHDPEDEVGAVPGFKKRLVEKAAYFYPVVQRTSLKPKRRVGGAGLVVSQGEQERIDGLNLTVVGLPEEEVGRAEALRAQLDPGA
ncbi:Paf1 [Teratosphaeria destructans]|uniref:Paf1 n=1 Tax=Teratosphaeria destructans TaxID=418781 RepID=A0A9W7SWK6_9PEZI|nr:Paf1 [Teratosphaeria destructans]